MNTHLFLDHITFGLFSFSTLQPRHMNLTAKSELNKKLLTTSAFPMVPHLLAKQNILLGIWKVSTFKDCLNFDRDVIASPLNQRYMTSGVLEQMDVMTHPTHTCDQ